MGMYCCISFILMLHRQPRSTLFPTRRSSDLKVDDSLFRPAEVDHLIGNSSKARRKLGWQPKVSFPELIAMMVDQDIFRLRDRKSTRLNSSHSSISYAVFCLKKKIH